MSNNWHFLITCWYVTCPVGCTDIIQLLDRHWILVACPHSFELAGEWKMRFHQEAVTGDWASNRARIAVCLIEIGMFYTILMGQWRVNLWVSWRNIHLLIRFQLDLTQKLCFSWRKIHTFCKKSPFIRFWKCLDLLASTLHLLMKFADKLSPFSKRLLATFLGTWPHKLGEKNPMLGQP